MLRASRHQGHARYKASGKQCVANSIQCMVTALYSPIPSKWTQSSLDEILENGDKLYEKLTFPSGVRYLSTNDLPSTVCGLDMCLSEPLCGTICRDISEPPFFTLEKALEKLINTEENDSMYLFTMGAGVPAYACSILKSTDALYFFDPHSRDNNGMAAADGLACMSRHKNLEQLCQFIKTLALSLNMTKMTPFELVQVHLSEDSSGSEFSGFSIENKEAVAHRLFLAEEAIQNVDVSDVSEVTSVDLGDLDQSITDSDLELSSDSSNIAQNMSNNKVFLNGSNSLNNIMLSDVSSSQDSEDDIPLSRLKEKCKYVSDDSDENVPLIRMKKTQLGSRSPIICQTVFENQIDAPISDVHTSSVVSPLVTERINSVTNESPFNESNTERNPDEDESQKRGRKRKRNADEWKRNVTKRRYNQGESYVDRFGIYRQGKKLKPGCGRKCRYKCHEKFNCEERENIFHSFWKLGTVEKRRQFVLHNTRKKPKCQYVKLNTRRQSSIQWNLPKIDGNQVQVCKTFFLHTVAISDKVVTTVHKKAGVAGLLDDSRGKHKNRPNQVSYVARQRVREHIKSFETVESHYCRKSSSKLYLPSDLSIGKMYHLYKEECEQEGIIPVKVHLYRDIFNGEFNLAFHKPLKDQCDLCTTYKNSSDKCKEDMKNTYDQHLKNKEMARINKQIDKTRASTGEEPELHVSVFDLEEILLTPNAFTSSMYYKRRLNTYNFSIYDLASRAGHCFVWHESIASRGGSEIASCVFSHIKTMVKKGKKEFIFYSDNCTAQNKNIQYVSMLWYCLQKFNLKSITHKYLEKGHTMNEGDSIHSSVERASRDKPIYSTPEWAATIRMARISQPYNVKEMGLRDFFDFKKLSMRIKNFEINTENDKLYWNKIKVFQLTSDLPNQFQYKTDYLGETHFIELFHRLRAKEVPDPNTLFLMQLRMEYISIPWLKFVDLAKMCQTNHIPSLHHAFYLLLPHLAQSTSK